MNKNTRIPSLLMAVFTLALIIPIGLSMNTIALTPQGLEQEVAQKITQTGVSNPVTAVLLNFRSFDTLLEVAVLLVALLTTQAIVNSKAQAVLPDFNVDDSILRGGIRIIAPLVFLIAGYILWVGGKAPGGAFQSGALLSSLMVLLWLADYSIVKSYSEKVESVAVVLGITIFTLVGVALSLNGAAFLQYPVQWAKELILVIEVACTISIGAILFSLLRAGLRTNHEVNQTQSQDSE